MPHDRCGGKHGLPTDYPRYTGQSYYRASGTVISPEVAQQIPVEDEYILVINIRAIGAMVVTLPVQLTEQVKSARSACLGTSTDSEK